MHLARVVRREKAGAKEDVALTGGQWVQRGLTLYWRHHRAADKPKGGRKPVPAVCGTERGYQRHRWLAKAGEPGAVWPLPADDACGCRAAHAAHEAFRIRNLRLNGESEQHAAQRIGGRLDSLKNQRRRHERKSVA